MHLRTSGVCTPSLRLKFDYWAGQVTPAEWAILITNGGSRPNTNAEKKSFSLEDILLVAAKVSTQTWGVFDPATPEVAAHCATLLMPPRNQKAKI